MLRESECIVCYSDILYHPDHIDALIHAPGDLSITYDELWRNLWEARFEHPLLDAETFSCKRGKLLGIGHRAEKLEDIQGQYMGLTLIRPDGWQKLEKSISQMRFDEINSLDMTSLFNRVISHDLEINTVPVKGRWCEVDSAADLNLYNNKLKSEEHWSHDWRWEYTI
jgi:choline kinase